MNNTTNRNGFSRRAFTGAALVGVLAWTAFASPPRAELRVVTTIPDLADLAREIGGDRVSVKSLSKGTENLHQVPVRPSMVVALNKADLLLQMGLSLESSWLPGLLLAARNKDLEPGHPGFVNCSAGWEALDVPENLSRRQGDLHPEGNPHFNLDPRAGRHLARQVHDGLVGVDPGGEEYYAGRLAEYEKKLEAAEKRWAKLGRKLAGKRVAVYHTEYRYLANQLGMEVATSIEPKPGIPPSPGDIARVVQAMKEKEVKVILTAAWSNNRQVVDVARKTGAEVLELPNQVGGASWAESWIAMQDGVHQRLAEAFGIDWKALAEEDG